MKTSNRNKLLGLALTGGFSLFGATNAIAAAGQDILNRATLSYDVSNTPQSVIESASGAGNGADTVFLEDRLINFLVAEQDGATVTVAPDAIQQVQTFDVTNNGNGTQDFIFASLDRTTGTADPHGGATNDNFDVASTQVFVDTVLDGVYVPADDTAIFADQVVPLGVVRVFIVSTIPDDLTVSNGDVAVMALVAQVADGSTPATEGAAIMRDDNGSLGVAGTYSNGGTTTVVPAASNIPDAPGTEEDVFNEPAGTIDSAGLAGAAKIGQTSDDSSYTVESADLTVTKTSEVIYDPINLDSFTDIATPNTNNPKALPGAYIQYTIRIENDALAAASADLTDLSDAISGASTASVTLDPNLLDDGKALAATLVFPADSESPLADAVRIDTSGTSRPTAGLFYCLSTGAGCTYSGGSNGTVDVDFTAVSGMGVEAGYTVGELKPGEFVEVVFNVIVQ